MQNQETSSLDTAALKSTDGKVSCKEQKGNLTLKQGVCSSLSVVLKWSFFHLWKYFLFARIKKKNPED